MILAASAQVNSDQEMASDSDAPTIKIVSFRLEVATGLHQRLHLTIRQAKRPYMDKHTNNRVFKTVVL
jgi:hypothetical protein